MPLRISLAIVCAIALTSGCAAHPSTPPEHLRPTRTVEPPFDGAADLPPPDMTDDGPGSLVEVKPLTDIAGFDEVQARAVRVVYRSTSGDGRPTRVSGVVVVPPGTPPTGGWPVLSFGHMLTGVLNQCAPSLGKDVGGYSSVLGPLVGLGYVVTMTDYQGLGIAGFDHPPLDGTTLGNNMIDAVRAARRVLPSTSTRWAAYGPEQGALAAWAASEQGTTYGRGLELVGAIALSPIADMSQMADAAANGTLSPQLYRLYTQVLDSLAGPPDDLNLDLYRSESAKTDWDALTNCALADPAEGDRARARLQPQDLRPHTQAATDELRRLLTRYALPGQSANLAAPVLVVYATDDPILPATWVDRAVRAACARGEPIEVSRRIGETSTTNPWIIDYAISWLRARFDGQAVANVCVGVS
jgi:pimeloyl-ACP methyl ester carboxylesterase